MTTTSSSADASHAPGHAQRAERVLDLLQKAAGKRNLNARATAGLLDNPGRDRRAVLDAAAADKHQLAAALNAPAPFGQSPFALGQGNRFERRVKENGYEHLTRVVREVGFDLPEHLQTTDIGGGFDMADRAERTHQLLAQIMRGDTAVSNVIDQAVTTINVGGQIVYLEQDALAFRDGDQLRICEVKGFPIVDGSADPHKTGAAARQTAVYVASIQDTLLELDIDPARVSLEIILICPRNYSITPTARVINVERELRALRRQLQRRSRVFDVVGALDDGPIASLNCSWEIPASSTRSPLPITAAGEGRWTHP